MSLLSTLNVEQQKYLHQRKVAPLHLIKEQCHRMAYNYLIWFPNTTNQVPNPTDLIRFPNPLTFEIRQGTCLKSNHIYS